MTKVRTQSVDEVSAGRLGEGALRGLENVPPPRALRVTADEKGGRLTHGASGSADAVLSVSWPSSAAPGQIGQALDEAARFAYTRLGVQPSDVIDAMLSGLMTFDTNGSYKNAPEYADLRGQGQSGCEIIGAALQDWGRSTLVGTRTSGRTTIQSIGPLANGGAIRLTTAHWFTPKGRSLESEGLTPDTEIAPEEDPGHTVGTPERDVQPRRAGEIAGTSSPR